jgi:hypothetical protein
MKRWRCYAALLPEEDAIDDPEEDGDVDPTVPSDLWFSCAPPHARRVANDGERSRRILAGGRAPGHRGARHCVKS